MKFFCSLVAAVLLCSGAAAEESEWQFDAWAGPSIPVTVFAPDDAGSETKMNFPMVAMRLYNGLQTMPHRMNGMTMFIPATIPPVIILNTGNM